MVCHRSHKSIFLTSLVFSYEETSRVCWNLGGVLIILLSKKRIFFPFTNKSLDVNDKSSKNTEGSHWRWKHAYSIVDVSIVTRLGVMKEKVFCCQTLCVWRLKCRPSSLNRAPSPVITIYSHAFFALTSHISTHVCRSFKIVTVGSPLDIARSISETKL